MISSDFHMHTSFSTDCQVPPREMIEGAIKKGLQTICITDHMDKDFPICEGAEQMVFIFDADQYFEELTALQKEYIDQIDVRIGVEIGLQAHLGEYYKELMNNYPFDFVIGSVHVVHGRDPYYGELFRTQTDEEAYRETFEATLENLHAISNFDVLGHIDYVVRYGKEKATHYSYAKYKDCLDAILQQVIKMDKGIELNMSGFKYELGFGHPHIDVLKRYHELGGEIITIGSDGHAPEHIGYEFERAYDILKVCGFKYYTEFRNRKPIFKQLT